MFFLLALMGTVAVGYVLLSVLRWREKKQYGQALRLRTSLILWLDGIIVGTRAKSWESHGLLQSSAKRPDINGYEFHPFGCRNYANAMLGIEERLSFLRKEEPEFAAGPEN